VSLFSGVGGLEADGSPELLCEIDADCRVVLHRRFGESRIHDDVTTLKAIPGLDVVLGGWPCQDISVAGLRRGLAGARSGLLFHMIDFAQASGAGAIIAENVPNLLRLESGENFRLTLEAFEEAGYPFVAWRVLNARQFGLPHERRRVFLIASQDRETSLKLLRDVAHRPAFVKQKPQVAGFYWTAGIQGINFSVGFSPTLKVGSSLSIPSPPAMFYNDVIRTVSPFEALALQGFPKTPFKGLPLKAVHRMMGNAVALPVGRFVAKSLNVDKVKMSGRFAPLYLEPSLFGDIRWPTAWPKAGFKDQDEYFEYLDPVQEAPLSTSLEDFIDMESSERLSVRAAKGLLSRLDRSGKSCPPKLRTALSLLAQAY
jgi:DNA (cytosine-5)-methyltransferase 1